MREEPYRGGTPCPPHLAFQSHKHTQSTATAPSLIDVARLPTTQYPFRLFTSPYTDIPCRGNTTARCKDFVVLVTSHTGRQRSDLLRRLSINIRPCLRVDRSVHLHRNGASNLMATTPWERISHQLTAHIRGHPPFANGRVWVGDFDPHRRAVS